jgi:hypothetical protein
VLLHHDIMRSSLVLKEAVWEELGHTYCCMQAVQLTCRLSCISTAEHE